MSKIITSGFWAETLLRVGDETGTRADRTIVKFDFSNIGITDASQVASAYLYVRTNDNPVAGNVTVDAFRIKKDWNEGTKSYAQATTDEVTWTYQYYNTTAWTGAGCDNTADRSTTSEGTQTFAAADTWYSWNVTYSVRYMFDKSEYYGWILKGQNEGTARYWRVYSSEHGTADYRPYLEITYLPSGPPAPVATAATGVTPTSFSANWNASAGATGSTSSSTRAGRSA